MKKETLHKIVDYFRGKLSDKEKEDFIVRQKTEEAFAQEVEDYKIAEAIIKANHRDQLIADTQQMMQAYETKQPSFFLHPIFKVAAAVALLIIALWGSKSWWSTPSADTLFAQYFELPQAPNLRGNIADTEQLWQRAMSAYTEENYPQAIQQLERITKNTSTNRTNSANFYLGLCYLMQNEYEPSLAAFKGVQPTSSYFQEALWYRALVNIKKGDLETAQQTLREIATMEGHFKRKVAAELLKKIVN
ncbi:MAG: tetratricopeptide repeat protein [Bacteroidota bacterium]